MLAEEPSDAPPKATLAGTLRRLGPAAPLFIAVTCLPPIGTVCLILAATTTSLPQWMREHPQPAFWLYIGVFWILGICCLPTYAYSVLGGWALGFWPAMIGTTLAYGGACSIAFAIARRVGPERVNPLIDEHPRLVSVRRVMLSSSYWRSLLIVSLLRIVPVSPFAITNVVLGSIGVRWSVFLLGSAIGVIPRTAFVAWFAANLAELPLKTNWAMYAFAGAGALGFLLLIVLSVSARKELDRQLRVSDGAGV